MKLGLKARRVMTSRLTDLAMVFFLIITLFPIGWMIYCSFKSNDEILTGKVWLGRSPTDGKYLESHGDSLYLFTSDGAVSLFSVSSGELLRYRSIKGLAVDIASGQDYFWLSSVDRGLIKMRKTDFQTVKRVRLPFENVEVTKTVSSRIVLSGYRLWVALNGEKQEKIAEYDQDLNRLRTISLSGDWSPFQITALYPDGEWLWLATDKGLLKLDQMKAEVVATYPFADSFASVENQQIVKQGGQIYVGTITGIYRADERSQALVPAFGLEQGLTSERINCLTVKDDWLLAGTDAGISVIDPGKNKVVDQEVLFQAVDQNGLVLDQAPEAGEVLCLIFGEDQAPGGPAVLLAGGFRGRAGQYSVTDPAGLRQAGQAWQPAQKYLTKRGHLMFKWRNYLEMWKNIDFGLYLKNSLIICTFTMVIAMIFATLAAYSLSRFNFPGNQLFGYLILSTQMVPTILYLIPIYSMFVGFNNLTGIMVKGTYVGLIFIYSAFFLPFTIWILRGFFANIPVELEEAARIDGCGHFTVFLRITLPLAIPGIVATGIYTFLIAWDELMFAWMLTSEATMTIPVGIRNFVGNYQNRFDLMMAAATVATIPVIILFFLLQRHIVKGLTAGAVKG